MTARLAKYRSAIVYRDATTGEPRFASGASVDIYKPDTTTRVTAYSDSAGTVKINDTVPLGSDGLLEFYVRSEDRRVDLKVTPVGSEFTQYTIADSVAGTDDKTLYASEYASIQDAITAATAGQKVVITDDTTLTTKISITDKTDLTIEGESRGVTLSAGDAFNDDIIDVDHCTRLTIRNLSLDGNKTQQGAGPWSGINLSGGLGSSDCILEDLYITSVKGDGVQFENTTDLKCHKVTCTANTVNGFSHKTDSSTRAVRPSFVDCVASSNGSGVSGRGWDMTPMPDGAKFENCKAVDNQSNGFLGSADATAYDVVGMEFNNCHAVNNGVGTTASGLFVSCSFANNSIRYLRVIGGEYRNNSGTGISLTGNNANGGKIVEWSVVGVSASQNGAEGLRVLDDVSYGSISGGQFMNNTGEGIEFHGTTTGAASARFNTVIGATCGDDDAGNQTYGIRLNTNSESNTVIGCICEGNATGNYADSGRANVILGSTPATALASTQGGMLAPIHGSNQGWFDTWLEVAAGAASASAANTRITTKSRIVSLVARETTAAAILASAGGWFHVPSGNSASSHAWIEFRTAPVDAASGEFSILLFEPLET